MCGIVGIVGTSDVAQRLFGGLKRLEYRGYDSAGICTIDHDQLVRRRAEGKLDNIARVLTAEPLHGTVGIAHTRWATHGAPTVGNAHPHIVGPGALVHNGIIENVKPLRDELIAEGRTFESETDTEVGGDVVEAGTSSAPVETANSRPCMQKEMFEQPIVVAPPLQTYLRPFEGEVALPVADADFASIERVAIVACGPSSYVAMIGKYWIE